MRVHTDESNNNVMKSPLMKKNNETKVETKV